MHPYLRLDGRHVDAILLCPPHQKNFLRESAKTFKVINIAIKQIRVHCAAKQFAQPEIYH